MFKKRVFRLIFLVFTVWLAVKLAMTNYTIWKRQFILSDRQKEFAEAEAENRRLKRELENIRSPEFLEREARDKLGLGKPGETVIILTSPNPTPGLKDDISSSGQKNANLTVWEQWLRLFY